MQEIELSLMYHNEPAAAALRTPLDQFEAQSRIHVNLNILPWSTGRSELNKVALYHHGPDVSEIGTTWASDLIAMNALHPFTPSEINLIGRADEFLPSSWGTGHLAGDDHMWAFPYTADTYLVYYRKDLLRKAGVDAATAFQTHAQLTETVIRLEQSGHPMPVILPDDRHSLLHSLASWVWAYGGDFCTAEGNRIQFDQPQAQSAMQAYFGLLRHIAPGMLHKLTQETSIALFCQGQAAIHFHDLPALTPEQEMLPEVYENWGIAPLPQPHFIGGTNLVVWNHSQHLRACIDLVRFLTSVSSMAKAVKFFRMLPPRLAVMSTPEFQADTLISTLGPTLQNGRSYPSVKLWGLIEDRLIDALLGVRSDVLSNPQADIPAIIQQRLLPLAKKLNITLSQY